MDREFVILFDAGHWSVMSRFLNEPTSTSRLEGTYPSLEGALYAIQTMNGGEPVLLRTITRGVPR